MHFAISATYGPTDPTRAMLPFIFAASAVQSDDQVTLMLFADSVLMAVEGVGAKLVPVGPPNKYEEIAGNPNVNVSFADAAEQKYVSVTGTAVVSNDRAKIKQLFSTEAKAWWDSADDPNIRVLEITPDDAEFWDSPGTVISYVKMAAAAVTNTRPEIGDNRKVSM